MTNGAAAVSCRRGDGVSIVVPNWNHRPFLPRCIASALEGLAALARLGVRGEIVVVDDDSRDGSQRWLTGLKLCYGDQVRVRLLERNVGLAGARNVGIRHARYRHAVMLDADNELIGENLPLFYRAIRDTGATLAYGNLMRVRSDGEVEELISHDVPHSHIYGSNYIDAFSLIDADVVERLGGYRKINWEDWELVLHLLSEEQPVVFVPALLGRYHLLEESMTNELMDRYDENWARLRRMYNQRDLNSRRAELVGRVYHPDVGYMI